MKPPRHTEVVSIDEKSQIQALNHTHPPLTTLSFAQRGPWQAPPGLPMKQGKCAILTHDYRRNGTTTLFAAFSVLEGKVIGRCVPRHRHQE